MPIPIFDKVMLKLKEYLIISSFVMWKTAAAGLKLKITINRHVFPVKARGSITAEDC